MTGLLQFQVKNIHQQCKCKLVKVYYNLVTAYGGFITGDARASCNAFKKDTQSFKIQNYKNITSYTHMYQYSSIFFLMSIFDKRLS